MITYRLKVSLKWMPDVWRLIEIEQSQTLHHLHKIIQKAFGWDDDHLYSFFLSNKAWDGNSEYGGPGTESARKAKRATIESLNLHPGGKMLYLFDFGDCLEHEVQLLKINRDAPLCQYPKIVEEKGVAPPQYSDYDEEEVDPEELLVPFGPEETRNDRGKGEIPSVVGQRMAVERVLSNSTSGVQETSVTPLEQAQNLIYDAWEIPDRKKRIALARKALKISPDCADAYNLLAEDKARTFEDALDLYQKGVEAGKRALGDKAFREDKGHFWGVVKTRPYMRARVGLANCLWALGKHNEAIEHFQDMLCLNPGDNQGIRYLLLDCLLECGRFDEAERLIKHKQYANDGSAAWLYSWALLLFNKEGNSTRAHKLLSEALKTNPYVPGYLLKRKLLPREIPHSFIVGDETEAICYTNDALEAWQKYPEALEWLASYTGEEGQKYSKVG